MQALQAFAGRPVVRASLTSGSVMALADVVCQRIQSHGKHERWKWDSTRTARFAIAGATLHGPYFLWGFQTLDRVFGPARTITTALTKTGAGQVTLFPVYLTAFFMYISALEGKGVEGGIQRVKTSFTSTYITGSVFWPIANVINFMYVPATQRVLYVNACGLVWNAFLSWVNSTAEVEPKLLAKRA